jgi:hexosaminidase
MNYFHLHLSQDDGFRLESSSHPEIVSAQHYTKQDIRDLLDLASRYYVMVVPEIDVPSHARAIIQNHPELQLGNHPRAEDLFCSTISSVTCLMDLSQPGTSPLINDLLQEYLPLFPAPYWHTGADEYLLDTDYALYPQYTTVAQQLYGPTAVGQDLYVGLINQIDGIVKQHGKQLRAWNDLHGVSSVVNKPNKDIVLELFSANIGAANALRQGFQIVNCSPAPLYYVLGQPSLRADPVNLYENWAPNLQFVFNESVPPLSPGLRGGKLHVWADSPNAETVDQIQQGIFQPFRSFSQNSWGSPKPVPSFGEFSGLIATVGRVPGWDPDFGVIAPDNEISLPPGGSVTINLTVKANSSFNGAISGTCSSKNNAVACDGLPNQLALAPTEGQNVAITVTNRTPAAVAWNQPHLLLPVAGTIVCGLLLIHRRRPVLAIALGVCFLICIGCGSPSERLTLTFSSGAVSHSITISIDNAH